MENKRAVVIYNKLSDNPEKDEIDVLNQLEEICKSLVILGYEVHRQVFSSDMTSVINSLKKINPGFAFFLVESFDDYSEFCYLANAILEYLQIPYTGGNSETIFVTSNKVLTKKLLTYHGIPTAEWFFPNEVEKIRPGDRYIVKPTWEDGSVGIDNDSVFYGNDNAYIEKLKSLDPGRYFVEKYIDGREFTNALLAGYDGPLVMLPAEFLFKGFTGDKPKILGYIAKWAEDDDDYINTPRSFDYTEEDQPLLHKIREISLKCWNTFNLKGYARVDYRVDKDNNPYVLELNQNPCISPDSGFVAACQMNGIDYVKMIERIVADINRKN